MAFKNGEPITRADALSYLAPNSPGMRPEIQHLYQSWLAAPDKQAWMRSAPPVRVDTDRWLSPQDINIAFGNRLGGEQWLQLMDKYGVDKLTDLPEPIRSAIPNGGVYVSHSPKTFGDLFKETITHPAVLLMLGGVAGVAYGGGAAAAGAAEGTAGTGAATAGGASGLEAGLAAYTPASAAGSWEAALASGSASGSLAAGGAGTAMPGEAGYLGGESAMTSTTGATNTLPGQAGTTAASGTAINTAASGTALSRILGGNGTAEDYMQLFGQVAPALLGAYASDRQADKIGNLAARYDAMGSPYRDRLAAIYQDPTAFLNSPEVKVPVQMGTDALARALSTQGNPAGSGTALHEIQNYATNQLFGRLGQEKDRLAGFGGLTAYNQAAPQAATNAINAERGFYDALGYGVGQVTNPPRSLADILKQYNTAQGLA